MFHTFIYLQGSQTEMLVENSRFLFHTFIYLQGSQTVHGAINQKGSFTPLFTYKVLKPWQELADYYQVSHLYLLTRFSNIYE